MKPAVFTGALLLLAGTVNAQFSLLPQVGFERTNTALQYNNLSSFSPLGGQATFKANLRADYRFKKGHGPFVGIGTSPAVVAVDYTSPSDMVNTFKAAAGALQWRTEAGYQYSSKPIQLKKAPAAKSTAPTSNVAKSAPKAVTQPAQRSGNCGARTYSHCGAKPKSEVARTEAPAKVAPAKKVETLNLRLQPYAGVAYIPNVKESFANNGAAGYRYNAGNWNTAFISGIGFEFGKGSQRLSTLSVHYAKGIGNLQTQSVTTSENGKTSIGTFRSSTSSWGLTLGVPFTLAKKAKPVPAQPAVKEVPKKENYKNKCGSYYRSSSVRFI